VSLPSWLLRRPKRRVTTWLLAAVIVLLIPVSGFEAYALHTRLTPTTYERGGVFLPAPATETPGTTPSTTPGGTTGPPPATASAAVTPGAASRVPSSRVPTPGGTSTAAPGASGPASSARGATRSVAASPSALRSTTRGPGHVLSPAGVLSGPALPATGLYTLAVSGTESASFGPIGLCSGKLPTTAQLAISHATDESSTSYDYDLRLYPDSPNRHDERHIYRYASDAVLLDFEEATVTCAGVKQSTTVNYAPEQIRARLPLATGASWTSHGGDSGRTEDTVSKVTGTDAVTVGGTTYPVFVIETQVRISGSESGTRLQRWWFSPQLGLPLRTYEKIHASRSGGSFDNEYTATISAFPSAGS
jgi:hypothetical protein